jgi:cell division protein FtsL
MIQAGHAYSRNWNEQPISQPATQVKKVKYKKTNRAKILLLKVCALVFIYSILLVYLCLKSATLGYQLVELENEITRMENTNARIEYEIAQKSSLDRVEKAASALGMQKPEGGILIVAAGVPGEKGEVPIEEKEDGSVMNIGEKPLEKLYASLVRLSGNNY